MTIVDAKASIAKKARLLGFHFDESELIDVLHQGMVYVFLRSIKVLKSAMQPDGLLGEEWVNDPIIWIEYLSPLLSRVEPDFDNRVFRYQFYAPKFRVLYPELIEMLPPD